MEKMLLKYLKDEALSVSDIDYFIPHQSNGKMILELSDKLSIPDNKVLMNIENFGNTGSASIAICYAFMNQHHNKFSVGDRILMFSIGAGYTLSLVDFKWDSNGL